MRPHSYPRAGHPGQFGAASAWPVNVTMPDRGGVDAPWAEQEPAGDHAGGDLIADHDDHLARSGASPGSRAAAWRLTGDAIDPAAASEQQAPGCGRTRGRCRESSGNGPEFPLQRLPEAVPGAAAVRAPALARVPAWAAVAAGAGVPGAAQAVRVLAVAQVPAGAPAAAGVPAAPAMVWAAATAAVPGAAAAALAAVAAAGPAAAVLVRGVPVPAMPVPAGWDRRVRRPHELRERGRDLLPPWDTSRPRGNYPRSGRLRAGGVHAGHGGVRFCAPRQRGRWRRGARRRPAGPPGW